MNKKYLVLVVFTLIIVIVFSALSWLGHFKIFQDFVTRIENSSFDIRQSIVSKYKVHNDDIVILAVDDESYEYIMDKYGSWPISRKVWADSVDFIEKVNPKFIVFDMLFLKSNLNDKEADNAFVKTVKNNQNIYLSINFDNYSDEIRQSPVLPDKIKLKVKSGSLSDNSYISFINSRMVMKELLDVTDNIGSINVTRDNDGIIRNVTPVFKYKNDYYPNLTLAVAINQITNNNQDYNGIEIKNDKIFIDKTHFLTLDNTQRVILNWYGPSNTFKHISLWQVIKAQKNNDINFIKKNFENKIVYIGTTVTSLSDIKSVPTESNLAGVELHTTFLNNILDNNFIKKVSMKADLIASILFSLLIGYLVLKTQSVLKTFVFLFLALALYALSATYLMHKCNLWINLTIPYMSAIATFIFVYCEKYILKVKDYEQTYKLAVTDGLTQLYNHRYFQEQMIVNTSNYNRYGTAFSIILIDIDFFKKFNDTYGHQSGDCVLKQVAQILKRNSRNSDIACRYGGEEMSVILTNTVKKDAVTMANKICLAVRNNKFTLVNGEKVNVTISVGVACAGDDGKTPQEIIEYSDKCLYKAKEGGRNQVISEV